VRILFAGTGEIAVKTLFALSQKGLVCGVLTTPDAPGKRGKALLPSPVKAEAIRLGMPVLQPEHLMKAEREEVMKLSPDTLVSFCYGKIFGPKFLSMFERTYNIHPSLLPKHRGCAPIYATILEMDKIGGVSIQEISEKCDEGRIYSSFTYPLDGTETDGSLTEKVSSLVPEFAVRTITDASLEPAWQVGDATWTGYVKKEDGVIDFNKGAKEIHALIRACHPWPKAVCKAPASDLFLTGVSGSAFDIEECQCPEEPGTVVSHEKGKGFKIATGLGYLYVSSLQAPTKKEMDSASFLNGNRWIVGSVLK